MKSPHQIKITTPRTINTINGNVRHIIKSSELSNDGFGEAYFTEVNYLKVKGWKKHLNMHVNLVVAAGTVRFVYFNEVTSSFQELTCSQTNYKRLYVPPLTWFAFQGLTQNPSVILNISSMEHDPAECEVCDIDTFNYKWDTI